ncbi:patatin-like phospholipase family protein [Ectothiorhodospiraceae bacterium WFHF3C12]|nr:patatin-like phospholipase family protein [Ectothiorhodospiraceae bacterium WFHF3C12]
MSERWLDVFAGREALRRIRDSGLRPEDVDIVTGASGGPKWFVLYGLDRVLWSEWFAHRRRPLSLIGSSSGSWRFAAACQNDPLAALERFEAAYREQRFPHNPPAELVTETARRTMDAMLGSHGVREILGQPGRRLAIVVNRLRGLPAQAPRGRHYRRLALGAVLNLARRDWLGRVVERLVFHVGDADPLAFSDRLPTRYVPLTEENLRPALLASGSIPRVMAPVLDIPGAGPGVYYDGGITDYHFAEPFPGSDGLALMPHFYPYAVPGWFDKLAPWRRRGRGLDRTVLLAPSEAFLQRLPQGKIPDRNDFLRLPDAERARYWKTAVDESRRLGDALSELVAGGRLSRVARPLP